MRTLHLGVAQAQRLEMPSHRAVEGVAAELVVLLDQALLADADRPLHHRHIRDRLGAAQPDRALLELALDPGDVGARCVADLDRRARVGADELGEVGGDHPAPAHRPAGVGLVEAGEDPKEGGLAGAVLADDADPGPLGHLEVEARARFGCRTT